MGAANYVSRHSSLPVLNWLGGRAPKAYLRIESSRRKLASAARDAEDADEENVLSAGDSLREADLDSARTASDTDIFGAGNEMPDENESLTGGSRASESQAADGCGHGDSKPVREVVETLSIDELRELACALQVHDRSRITEKSELVEEVCKRL